MRRRMVWSDLIFCSASCCLLFFSFCYLVNQWGETDDEVSRGRGSITGASALQFFAVFAFAGQLYFAYGKYRQGAASAFAPSFDAAADGSMPPYASGYPGAPSDQYQVRFIAYCIIQI